MSDRVIFIEQERLGVFSGVLDSLSGRTSKARVSAFRRIAKALSALGLVEAPLANWSFIGRATGSNGAQGILVVLRGALSTDVRTTAPESQREAPWTPESSKEPT